MRSRSIDNANIAIVIIIVCVLAIVLHHRPYDSTDPDDGRSGLSLYIDELTGCQYIRVGLFTKLTPRLDEQGAHLCKGDEQRWQEFYVERARLKAEIEVEKARWNALTVEEQAAERQQKIADRTYLKELLAEKRRRLEEKRQ